MRILQLDAATLRALGGGDLAAADRTAPVPLTPYGREPCVTTVRASVSPDNVASRDLVLSEGLLAVGEQIDDEDGLEIVHELTVGTHPAASA